MSREQDKKPEKVIITEVKKVNETFSAQSTQTKNFERVNTVDSSTVKRDMNIKKSLDNNQ